MWLLAVVMLSAGVSLAAQDLKKPIAVSSASVEKVLSEIEKNSDYLFMFSDSKIDTQRMVSISTGSLNVDDVLKELFSGTSVVWKKENGKIILTIGESQQTKAAAPTAETSEDKPLRVTGVVKDAGDGLPLIGVNVILKNNPKVGTATDINGNYVIDAKVGDILIFNYVGYSDVLIPVDGRTEVDLVMKMDTEELNQATVVGYGTQKRISVIGAQQNISAGELKAPAANLTTSIAGRVAGVVSMSRSGEPGYDDATIYIRGISTLTASMSEPLTLVDGVPRNISQVDPEDIESFTILKDASATAIYGVRGANGVIIINTKSGSAGKPKFDIRYTEGFTRFTAVPEFVDAPTYMALSNEALSTRGQTPRYTQEDIEMTRSGADPYLYPDIDWMKILFKDFGRNRTANANISGGSDMAVYYVGLSYYGEDGLYKVDRRHDYNANTSYARYSVTSNLTLKPHKTTEIKLGIQGYLANANYPAASNSTIFGAAFATQPNYIFPVYPNGYIADRPSGAVTNPYAILNEQGYAEQWRSQLFSNLKLTQQLPWITEGLSISGMFSFDIYSYTSNRYTRKPTTFMALGRDEEGYLVYQQTATGSEALSYGRSSSGNREIYLEAAINYKRSFNEHDVSGMLLYNQSDELNTAASSVETALPYRFMGLAGRFTYAYADRYFAEFNFGYNGSENFAPDNRFGFFPSVGLGWAVSNEKWFEPASKVINFMKLRATWGKVGNAKITGRRFAYLATIQNKGSYTFGQNGDQSFSGLEVGEEAVDVSWETAYKWNLGLDINTLGNALSLHADAFYDMREGIFLSRGDLPWYVGMTNMPLGNLGKVKNKGFEVSAEYKKQFNDDWFLSLMANCSFNRNEVVDNDVRYAYPWLDVRGQRVGQRYGYIAEKLFDSDEEVVASAYQSGDTRAGDIKYKDLNGDGKIDQYDKAPIGWGSVPEIMYGFGFSLAYKGWSLSAMFQGAGHVDVHVGGVGVSPFSQGLSTGNIMSNISCRWTEANPRQDVFYPRLSYSSNLNMNYETSTWWLHDASYVRLKNLQLAYAFPKVWLQKIHLSNLTLFLQGTNLLTFSEFELWDVEKGDGRGSSYPNTASYSIGLNFSF